MEPIDVLQSGVFTDPQGITHTGGLYPGGVNTPPASLQTRLQKAVNKITGPVGIIGLGASNALYEGMEFEDLTAGLLNAKFVNGALGSKNLEKMQEGNYWSYVHNQIALSGISDNDVQIAILESNTFSNLISTGSFEDYKNYVVSQLTAVCQRALVEFPNLKIIYFGGTCTSLYALAGYEKFLEPWAYYLSWAIKALIEKQINGDPSLSISGPTKICPLLAWMTPQWSDGATPNAFGFSWDGEDVFPAYPGAIQNGVHPSTAGAQLVANTWLNFFQTDIFTSQFFY